MTEDFDALMLVFRVLFGLTFAYHGWAKRFAGGRIAGTARWFDSMGMRPGRLHAQAASITEIVTGLMLVLGVLTPVASAGVVGVMVVAGWTVHRKNGFAIVGDGWEYTFVVGLIAVAIAGFGPGKYSLDAAYIDMISPGLAAAGLAIGLGVAAAVAQLIMFYRPNSVSEG